MTFCAPEITFEMAMEILDSWNGYYIVGRCLCGSRHESEKLTYEEALAEMPKYIATVNYFGGGVVELYDWNGNIVKSKVAIDFDYNNIF